MTSSGAGVDSLEHVEAVLFDLLMAVMNSVAVWSAAADDERRGLAWRDAVTRKMAAAAAYVPYEELVVDAAGEVGLAAEAPSELFERWREMEPWTDVAALSRVPLPYAFVTNCSKRLAGIAADRSQLSPRFVLSAEEAGWYKPDPRVYHQACRRLVLAPESTLFVAGSPYDADGARAAGLSALLVARRSDVRARRGAPRVIDSLDDVASALARLR